MEKSSVNSVSSGIPREFKKWLKANQLVDVWRKMHGLSQNYTFYSGRHDSYS